LPYLKELLVRVGAKSVASNRVGKGPALSERPASTGLRSEEERLIFNLFDEGRIRGKKQTNLHSELSNPLYPKIENPYE
jgi:hypothetical protein